MVFDRMVGIRLAQTGGLLTERLESGFSNWTLPLSVVVFLLVALVVAQILNVVRLSVFGRRYLIRSMELVGAPPNRIRRPFIGEAMETIEKESFSLSILNNISYFIQNRDFLYL